MTSPTDDLAVLRDVLAKYAAINFKAAPPDYLPDGSEVSTPEEYAALAGIPVVEAHIRMGRKDVYGGAGAANRSVGVGTVTPGRKKKRKGPLIGRARRLAGYQDCDCPPGEHTKDCCDG